MSQTMLNIIKYSVQLVLNFYHNKSQTLSYSSYKMSLLKSTHVIQISTKQHMNHQGFIVHTYMVAQFGEEIMLIRLFI